MSPDSTGPSSLTLGELNRNIIALRDDLRTTRAELVQLHDLRAQLLVGERRLDEHNARLEDIEGTLSWAGRLVVGLLITAALGVLLYIGSLPS